MRGAFAIMIVAAVLGCDGEGGVSLSLELPSDSALDPLDDRVSGLTLSVLSENTTVYTATREFGELGEAVDFGRVPIADGLRFELVGRTSSSRVVAFGRSAAAVDVTSGDLTDVAVRVRRPYVYAAGGDDLLAIDTTLDRGDDYALPITVGDQTGATATTPDGASVIVVAGTELRVIPTDDHTLTAPSALLTAPAVHVAVSPNSRWAAVTHTIPGMDTAPRGVSIVDLAAVVSGGADPVRYIDTAAVGEVSVTDTTVWVLQDPLASLTCEGASTVVPIDVESGQAGAAVDLGGVAADIAATDNTVYAAMPCDHEVRQVVGGVLAPTSVLDVTGVSAVSVAHGKVWAMGHVDGEGAHLILASAKPDGSDVRVLDFPTNEERAVATALVGPGQDGLIRMTADLSSAFDMAVLPDGEHVAILVAAIYITAPIGDAGGGQPILPVVRMITYEYQLAQISTGLATQRMRTTCAITWDAGALLDDFDCAVAPGQDVSPIDFVPTRLTSLFGSR